MTLYSLAKCFNTTTEIRENITEVDTHLGQQELIHYTNPTEIKDYREHGISRQLNMQEKQKDKLIQFLRGCLH